MEIHSIIAWGDSILRGAVSNGETKDFEILENDSLTLVARRLGLELTNKSIYGATIEKIQRTQQKNIRAGLNADIGLIEAGDNDCDYDWIAICQNIASGQNLNSNIMPSKCSLPDFERVLEEMIFTARQNKITPVLVTPPPLVTEWWFKNICIGNNESVILKFLEDDIQNLYRKQEMYSNAIEKIAIKSGVQFVNVRKEFLSQDDYRKFMCKDGIHPNEDGHKFMSEVFYRNFPLLKKEF